MYHVLLQNVLLQAAMRGELKFIGYKISSNRSFRKEEHPHGAWEGKRRISSKTILRNKINFGLFKTILKRKCQFIEASKKILETKKTWKYLVI